MLPIVKRIPADWNLVRDGDKKAWVPQTGAATPVISKTSTAFLLMACSELLALEKHAAKDNADVARVLKTTRAEVETRAKEMALIRDTAARYGLNPQASLQLTQPSTPCCWI